MSDTLLVRKGSRGTVDVSTLLAGPAVGVNTRLYYDLAPLKADILRTGRILNPLFVRKADNVVLRGNQRTLCGQELLADPATPESVKAALRKTEALFFDGLRPQEEAILILDSHAEKRLCRTEILCAIWRYAADLFTRDQILELFYRQLAAYTGQERKLNLLPAEPKERLIMVRKWLRPTLDYILAAAALGDYVRDQVVRLHKRSDGLPHEPVEINLDRVRIADLQRARNHDLEHATERTFPELLARFKDEDSTKQPKARQLRPTPRDLREKSGLYRSETLKKAFRYAAGDKNVRGLAEEDARIARWEGLEQVLLEAQTVQGPLGTLLPILLHGTSEELADFLEPLL